MDSITKEQFNLLKEKYGEFSSFTIWKSWDNVSDLSLINENNLNSLNNKYLFIALNPAEHPKDTIVPFSNFHSSYSFQKDFKLCYALEGTKFWGSYITDLFKSFRLTDSSQLTKELKLRPNDLKRDKEALINEINILGGRTVLIALNRDVEKHLKRLFKTEYKIVYIPHYSNYGSKEEYRLKVLDILNQI